MKSFEQILRQAKMNDPDAMMELFEIYAPLLKKASFSERGQDEDLCQHLILKFLLAVRRFEI